jgi:hypothetical protein
MSKEQKTKGAIELPIRLTWSEVMYIRHYVEEAISKGSKDEALKSISEKTDDYLAAFKIVEDESLKSL